MAVVCGAVMLVLMSVLYIVQSLKYESEWLGLFRYGPNDKAYKEKL